MKSSSPLVSVLIRNRNEAQYLKYTLHLLSIQKYNHFEIIFIDNESDDNSIEIAKKYNCKILILIKLWIMELKTLLAILLFY